MAKLKKFYSIFECLRGSEGGDLRNLKHFFDTEKEAEDWLEHNAQAGKYYVILRTCRKEGV